RFAGHDRANLAAKVLLVDGHRPSQLPYIAFGRERSHDDELVHQVQQHIDLHVSGPLRISELSSRFGLSERTLSRRFSAPPGRGPHAPPRARATPAARARVENTARPGRPGPPPRGLGRPRRVPPRVQGGPRAVARRLPPCLWPSQRPGHLSAAPETSLKP